MISHEILKEFALFEGINDEVLKDIAELCHERSYGEGDSCFLQGRKATELYLCRSGRVDVTVQVREPWGMEVTVHTATVGELFGWSAMVEPYVYTASAKCQERTEAICINRSDLLDFFRKRPEVGYLVMTNLGAVISSRLTESRLKLSKAMAAAANLEW
ncbi:MAG TPA: cyclic nucleotide-binding domain-containing protein [Dehalococcoidia bacterium]|nr:cyclic nucleotide-binding domain-containing protein [Dehalococcoidia bacterium]